MLAFFRAAAKTWVFRILFAILIASFAVWGIGNVQLGGAGSRVATVGDESVSIDDYAKALSREANAVSRQIGRAVTADEIRAYGIDRAVLSRILRDEALTQEAKRLGISADDAAVSREIKASPSFQGPDGKFDPQAYDFVLQRLGFDKQRFERDMRRSIARDIVAAGVVAAAAAPPSTAQRMAAYELETRAFRHIRLVAASDAPDPGTPTEEQLRTYYQDHVKAFEAPETREATYIHLDPLKLMKDIEIPEDELRLAYQDRKAEFDRPERRVLDRLVYPTREAAAAAAARVASGEATFADLAAEQGLSRKDVAIGDFAQDDLPPDEAKAVFAPDAPTVVGPVDTSFGPALINVRAILPARVTSFEEAKPTLREPLARDRAVDEVVHLAERVQDLRAGGASLEEIADQLGLQLHHIGPVDRASLAADTGDKMQVEHTPPFANEMFSAGIGEDRDMVQTLNGGYVLMRVDSIKEASERPLDEVRDKVVAAWSSEQRKQALLNAARDAKKELDGGADIADIATRYGAAPVAQPAVKRDAKLPDLAPGLLDAVFAAKPSGGAYVETAGGVAIAQVDEINEAVAGSQAFADAAERWRKALDQSVGRDLYEYYSRAVLTAAEPTQNPANVERVVSSFR